MVNRFHVKMSIIWGVYENFWITWGGLCKFRAREKFLNLSQFRPIPLPSILNKHSLNFFSHLAEDSEGFAARSNYKLWAKKKKTWLMRHIYKILHATPCKHHMWPSTWSPYTQILPHSKAVRSNLTPSISMHSNLCPPKIEPTHHTPPVNYDCSINHIVNMANFLISNFVIQ